MSALHPLTMLTWFLWGFFMGLGFAAAYGLARASIVLWHLGFATYHRNRGGSPAKRKGPKFEYQLLTAEAVSIDILNHMGIDGWQMVTSTPEGFWMMRPL